MPSYIKFFHGKQVSFIAAGAFYSLAVTDKGEMFSWGEAKLGQLGIGRHREVRTPKQIDFPPSEDGEHVRIKSCAAGFGHSAALSTENSLFMWGFNTYGQVGLGDKKTHWLPERILSDAEG